MDESTIRVVYIFYYIIINCTIIDVLVGVLKKITDSCLLTVFGSVSLRRLPVTLSVVLYPCAKSPCP